MKRRNNEHASLPLGSCAAVNHWNPDEQVFGYREIKTLVPHRVVQRGVQVHALPRDAEQISPHWTWNGQAMDVDRYMEVARTSGVIVLRGGRVILERYGLERTEKDIWLSQSVSKSVTSILVGAAIQDGYIKSMDDLVTEYIHELEGSAYEGVTIRQLLTMTSGVQYGAEDDMDLRSDLYSLWYPVTETGVSPVVSYMRRMPRAYMPGVKYNYSTADTHLAGILVSNAVGKLLSDYLSEKLWQPYGMEEDAVWTLDAAGYEHAGGGLAMSLRDLARFGQFMLDGGKVAGVQVLPPDWMVEATSSHVTFPPGDTYDRVGYGYCWCINKDGYGHGGYAGQLIQVYPKDKVVIAIHSAWLNENQPNRPEYLPRQWAFVETLHASAVTEPISG
ncbi:MAG: class C beta-lactamase-related serine hydrolase [Mesorhizobium sp.]|uniref:serine hydrolase domain-containing protein n=1 Tax=Mesorhizobium sp. TaxID=1871066 RepID=UPI000FE30281|nr:serine hydrolase [Mesorhizobium sp.]RWJ04407.1 MAG: class C beta-lactamase-related serine hydrolase [Mesorhizobium sp.]RWJ15170.1 MAG: class C beta-lactamase-related serine hydrolase [Mesorhizobium sp.]